MSFLELHTNLHHQETRTSKNLEPWGFALGCQSVDPASPVAGGPVEDPCQRFTSLQAFRGIFNTRKLQHRLQPFRCLETVSVAKLLHFGVLRSSGRPPRRRLGGRSSRRAGGRLRRPQTLRIADATGHGSTYFQAHTSQEIFQAKGGE